MTIILPWFNAVLSPSARVHWSLKAAAAKGARSYACRVATVAGYDRHTFAGYDGRIHVWIDFYAKTKNYPDHDNCLSACKAYLDGIADALGVNDKRFVPHPFVKTETVKGGRIEIRLTRGSEG